MQPCCNDAQCDTDRGVVRAALRVLPVEEVLLNNSENTTVKKTSS